MSERLSVTIPEKVYKDVMKTKPNSTGKSEHFTMYITKGIMEEWKSLKNPTNSKMMSQLLKQEVYTKSGKLKHLVDDKKVERFIEDLER